MSTTFSSTDTTIYNLLLEKSYSKTQQFIRESSPPSTPHLHLTKSLLYLLSNNSTQALHHLSQCSPNPLISSDYHLLSSLVSLTDPDTLKEALYHINRILGTHPTHSLALLVRSIALFRSGNLHKALNDVTYALELDPSLTDFLSFKEQLISHHTDYLSHLHRAEIALQESAFGACIESCSRALFHWKNGTSARALRARAYAAIGWTHIATLEAIALLDNQHIYEIDETYLNSLEKLKNGAHQTFPALEWSPALATRYFHLVGCLDGTDTLCDGFIYGPFSRRQVVLGTYGFDSVPNEEYVVVDARRDQHLQQVKQDCTEYMHSFSKSSVREKIIALCDFVENLGNESNTEEMKETSLLLGEYFKTKCVSIVYRSLLAKYLCDHISHAPSVALMQYNKICYISLRIQEDQWIVDFSQSKPQLYPEHCLSRLFQQEEEKLLNESFPWNEILTNSISNDIVLLNKHTHTSVHLIPVNGTYYEIHQIPLIDSPDQMYLNKLKALNHTSLQPYYDITCTRSTFYWCTPHSGTMSLYSYIERYGTGLSVSHIVPIAIQLLQGLLHLEEKGMYHGKVSSSHVHVKVHCGYVISSKWTQYGIHEIVPSRRLVKPTDEVSRVIFRAPEDLLESGNYSPCAASDVYGFGMILVHMMGGRIPWLTVSADRVVEKVLRERVSPPKPEAYPKALRRLARDCMMYEMKERPTLVQIERRLRYLFSKFKREERSRLAEEQVDLLKEQKEEMKIE